MVPLKCFFPRPTGIIVLPVVMTSWTRNPVSQRHISFRWREWVLAVKGWEDLKCHLESIAWARWANPRNDEPWNEDVHNCLHPSYNILRNREGKVTEEKWKSTLKMYPSTNIQEIQNVEMARRYRTSMAVITMWSSMKGVVFSACCQVQKSQVIRHC